MYKHHKESIKKVAKYFENNKEVKGLLLGGSIAHGFCDSTSDIDIMIIVSDDTYKKKLKEKNLQFLNKELCTYERGYVDGKYISMSFLKEVKNKGSEPARFAFKDAQILISHLDGLKDILKEIARYPAEQKVERIKRFNAQIEAWYWYTSEALRLQNHYLLNMSVDKLVLFSGRLILAHNKLLYPYHKWFLRVLNEAKKKPPNLLKHIEQVYKKPNQDNIKSFYETIKNFRKWESAGNWPNQFMIDSELNWRNNPPPIEDL